MSKDETLLELHHLSWVDAAARIALDPRLIVPVGALEQHGRNLPLGTNALITRRIAHDLSRAARVLCAPTLSYGVNVSMERHFVGTASLRPKTLHRALNDLLASWEPQGVKEFIIITAHRHEPHLDALATLVTQGARVRVVSIWDVPIGDLLQTQTGPKHGGEAEMSVMMHLYPDRVDMGRSSNLNQTRAGNGVGTASAGGGSKDDGAGATGDRTAAGRDGDTPDEKGAAGERAHAIVDGPVSDDDEIARHVAAASAEKGAVIYDRLLTTIRRAVLDGAGPQTEEDTDTL